MPSIHEVEGFWLAPATLRQIEEAVAHVLSACEPSASAGRVQTFVRLIALRSEQKHWGAAELAYAAQELPFDSIVNDKLRFNRPVMPADFERVINEIRSLRRSLAFEMTTTQRQRLIDGHGDEIDPTCFRTSGFDGANQPLYRYTRSPRARARG